MHLRLVSFLIISGISPSLLFASDSQILLKPVVEYSFCTAYEKAGYSLGVVGKNWALTFDVAKEKFSGKIKIKKAIFYRGQDMHKYIGKPAGPVRPPIPDTNDYTQTNLTEMNVDINRIEIFEKVKGPIELTIDDFNINSQGFHIPERLNIFCTGPLP